MNIFNFILLVLATWWTTKMFVDELGPYNLIEKLRNAIINEPWSPIYCFRCTSVWVSFGLTFLLHLPANLFVLHWLAASASAILIRKLIEKNETMTKKSK